MNPEELTDLKQRLIEAEQKLVDRINSRMPADNVPDAIALPMLNQLEQQQLDIEKSFRDVRDWLDTLAQ